MRKTIPYLLLVVLALAFSGCCTVKGVAQGAAQGAASGFNQDASNLSNPDTNGWSTVMKLDKWERDNLW